MFLLLLNNHGVKVQRRELEELYIPNMDFAKIDSLCRETLQRTLNFASIAG
jgi:hypothetical protein